MIAGEVLIVACVCLCALCCLLFWAISERERRFLRRTLAEMQRINDEWHQETQAFWGEVAEGPDPRAPRGGAPDGS